MTAVVLEGTGRSGKRYRAVIERDREAYLRAATLLERMAAESSDVTLVPNEPIAPETLGLRIDAMGFENWGQLFNDRQSLSLAVFTRLTKSVLSVMREYGLSQEYAKAVTSYLGITVDRIAVRGSNQCIYHSGRETVENEIARGVLPPVWDYVETVSVRESSGSWHVSLDGVCGVIEQISSIDHAATVYQADATSNKWTDIDLAITDPPYYAAYDYAGLSDFFYVWLKRSIGELYNELFSLPTAPKRQQAIMSSESKNQAARERYVSLMQASFDNIRNSVKTEYVCGVAFASIDPDAWATLIESLLNAGLIPDSSWPIDTEMESGMVKVGQARLKTSVWMACLPRGADAGDSFIEDVLDEMRPVIQERLLYFWSQGIRGADFFISAIGPALSVFGRHSRVLRPDGTEVTVRDFLDLVRREATQVALAQVLGGADLGAIDPATRQYVSWVWSYSRAPLDTGEAIALCLAVGADYRQVVRPGSIAIETKEGSKKTAKLRSIKERGRDEESLGLDSPARPAPLIDQLQRAAWLWGQNRPEELAAYRASLGETRWSALRTLGQAVAECLPQGDEDRRLINGLLGSSVMAATAPASAPPARPSSPATAGAHLPGFEPDAEPA